MCLLTYLPPGVMPDVEALGNGMIFNDDGHGYAIVAGDKIIVGRGLVGAKVLEEFTLARWQHPEGPALYHSRLATDGAESLANVHPFAIGGDPRTVMAHNGIMPLRPGKGDPRSDTRIVAEWYIPRAYRNLRGRKARLRFQRWMGRFNKVVILTVDNRFRDHAYILNEDEGIWSGGSWYSNDSYLPYTLSSRVNPAWWHEYAADDEAFESTVIGKAEENEEIQGPCGLCRAWIDFSLTECPYCGWCTDCRENPEDCQCYAPYTHKSDNALYRTVEGFRVIEDRSEVPAR